MNLPDKIVEIREGKPMVSSLQVAELYDKQHKHVLAAIQGLVISDKFREPNFRLSDYSTPGNNKRYPMYWMTRDGFWRLSMAFSQTPKAAEVCEPENPPMGDFEYAVRTQALG